MTEKRTIELKAGERIDDLQRNGYGIIQNTEKFCFGMDAVLLSGFAHVKKGGISIDLGTGTGIIPILMEAKTEGSHFTGLEIQEESADMARRSVELNALEEKIDIVTGDIKEAAKLFKKSSFDTVTTNPPYMTGGKALLNPHEPKAIARHELLCTLEDVVAAASALLKPQGALYMVHRPNRLVGIFEMMRKYRIEPKRMKMIHPFADKPANMVLIEGRRGGGEQLTVEEPLIIYKEAGKYTDEIYDIYGY